MQALTQYADGRGDGGHCSVVVGFDFGTSCTKIVVRTPFHYAGQGYAVDFAEAAHSSSPHLIPSTIHILPNGRISLSRSDEGIRLRDIKYCLMTGRRVLGTDGSVEKEFNPKVASVAFIAAALRRARSWFLREHRHLYADMILDWSLNIGLPSADFADTHLLSEYRDIAHASWLLSLRESDASFERAEEALASVAHFDDLNESDYADVHCIPEVAAEVTGYARSNLRNDGLHILMDIGASTLDVCSFVLHKQADAGNDDAYELLTTDVYRLGTMALYESRVAGAKASLDAHVRRLWHGCDPVGPIPEELLDYLPATEEIADAINRCNSAHAKECRSAIWQALVDLKTKRDPKSARWGDGLPLFMTGGASVMGFYRQVTKDISKEIPKFYPDCAGLSVVNIPKPEALVASVSANDYHRFAVAWGLSFPFDGIGSVTPPGDIEDIVVRPVDDYTSREITKEMV